MSKSPEHELVKEARKGHVGRIQRLLAKGVSINARAKFGQTPLFEAVLGGHVEAVRYLLEHGADPRLVSNDGAGPLYFACVRGDLEIVHLLIEYGADVNEVRRTECAFDDVRYWSPLDVALSNGQDQIIQSLIDAGAARRT